LEARFRIRHDWFEEPVVPEQLGAYRAVYAGQPIPVGGGETCLRHAKILTIEVALGTTVRPFDLAGSAAAPAAHNIDRHWRNTLVFTVHSHGLLKYQAVGNYYPNDKPLPRQAAI
jgi:hypothetical protein